MREEGKGFSDETGDGGEYWDYFGTVLGDVLVRAGEVVFGDRVWQLFPVDISVNVLIRLIDLVILLAKYFLHHILYHINILI